MTRARVSRLCAGLLASVTLAAMPTASAAAAAAPCRNTDALPGEVTAQELNDAVFCLVNKERTRAKRKLLTRDARLVKVAGSGVAADAAIGNGPASQLVRTDLTRRATQTGYAKPRLTWAVSEVTAWASGELSSPAAIVSGWMRSAQHRANLLARNFVHAGVWVGMPAGVAAGTVSPSATFVVAFGNRGRGR